MGWRFTNFGLSPAAAPPTEMRTAVGGNRRQLEALRDERAAWRALYGPRTRSTTVAYAGRSGSHNHRPDPCGGEL